jgi:putative flippase GtrA
MSAEPLASIPTGIFLRWWRFNLVGGIGIALQLALLFFLKSVLDLNYLAATGVAVEATVMHNFLWHERYTWMDRVRPSWRGSPPRLLRFHLTNGAVSIAGNLGLMKILVGVGHVNYMAANAAAIVVCSLFNFLVSDAYVFRQRYRKPAPGELT